MKTHNNDEEELSFITLAALTANVIEWLTNPTAKQDDEAAKDRGSTEKDERADAKHAEAVNERLRAIAAFERRYGRTIKR
jgi:hypothetical protein